MFNNENLLYKDGGYNNSWNLGAYYALGIEQRALLASSHPPQTLSFGDSPCAVRIVVVIHVEPWHDFNNITQVKCLA